MILRQYVQRTPGTIRLRWIWIDKTDKLSQKKDHRKGILPDYQPAYRCDSCRHARR